MQQENSSLRPGQSAETHACDSADELVEFATSNWRQRWVVTDIRDEYLLDKLLRRPFFLLVSVEAPQTTRWLRFQAKEARPATGTTLCPANGILKRRSSKTTVNSCETFEEFVAYTDRELYDPISGLAKLIAYAEVRLINSSTSMMQLHVALERLDLMDEKRLRPSWDQYFMQLASLAAQRSNCMKRRVGCVLVRERRVVSTGYNGTPRNLRNCNAGGCTSLRAAQRIAC